jgi:aspartokinase
METLRHFDLQHTHTYTEIEELWHDGQQLLQGIRLLQEVSAATYDHLTSIGQQCATRILSARLNQIGIPAEAYDGWRLGIRTNDDHQNALLSMDYTESIRKAFDRIDQNTVAVVTGGVGKSIQTGRITTLRAGSDLSATAVGASLNVGTS